MSNKEQTESIRPYLVESGFNVPEDLTETQIRIAILANESSHKIQNDIAQNSVDEMLEMDSEEKQIQRTKQGLKDMATAKKMGDRIVQDILDGRITIQDVMEAICSEEMFQ